MGSSSSKDFNYDTNLLEDTNELVHMVPDSKEDGFSAIYRNPNHPDGFDLPEVDGVVMDNVWALFETSVAQNSDNNCMGFRPFEGAPNQRGDFTYINYGTVHEVCTNLACGLATLGLKRQDTVGLYSRNRAEWMQVHLANQRQGYQTVALYDTLGDEAVAYILDHADISIVFCEKSAFDNVLAAHARGGGCLKTVVIFNDQDVYGNLHECLEDEQRAAASEAGLELLGITDLLQRGAENPVEPAKVGPDDICFLMYTSGTTGLPKGVRLAQAGFCMITYSVASMVPFYPDDRHVSFLPLAHIFECLVETVFLANGASIAYYQGNIKKLTDDWVAVKPTVIIGVPRVFSKVYDKVMAKAAQSSCLKKYFFQKALTSCAEATRTGQRVKSWDDKLWTNAAETIGFDQCRCILSGAAPMPPYLAEFLRIICVNGCVVQGYGLTESTGGSVVQPLTDFNLGHVGIPLSGVDIRLQDIPDMNYLTSDPNPRGEILIRGPGVMRGYLKNPDKTAETVVDGWLHTGDVGRINPNGTLSIIDRKKNLFKTSFGEYIAVEKIEGEYQKAPAVGQIWIYGNSFKSFVVAVVVPDALWAVQELKKKNLWPDDGDDEPEPATPEFAAKFTAIATENKEMLKPLIMKSLQSQEKELKRFERLKDIMLECEIDNLMQGFAVENGLLTPSFKKKRPILLKKYVEDLQAVYAENGEAPKEDEHWIKN